MQIIVLILVAIGAYFVWSIRERQFQRLRLRRRYWYRNVYLKSDAWRRKRYVVLKRDNWKCVHCGDKATQVHHLKYSKYNLGKEPIHWLESVCKPCHDRLHH